MQATDAKTRANRGNAKKSTGPRSEHGKAQVRQNALKHGLLAKQAFFRDDETRAEFDTILAEVSACWPPRDFMEQVLVENLALDLWKEQLANKWEISELQDRQDPNGAQSIIATLLRRSAEVLETGQPRSAYTDSGMVGKFIWDCDDVFMRLNSARSKDKKEEEGDEISADGDRSVLQVESHLRDRLEKLVRYARAIRRDRDRRMTQLQKLKQEREQPAVQSRKPRAA